ncbi:hypothetical protein [Paenibacillus piri]|uniref:DUF4181 domain-containing protein n=1 Tax=Paenibacillus piri TaxID=2547395 RepID=A0A4R5KSY3_9BACL|nr:hypothetical protein [Paenibacillus piri]TDF97980.1 hypothetical protein E1757_10700 [Paenibacillus piri]
MMIIAILFGSLAYLEWRYLKRNNRTPRTIRLVAGTAVILFLCVEIIYWFREQWTLSALIETVFGPIQKMMSARSKGE